MKKIPNRNAREYVQMQMEFNANNLSARWDTNAYIVLSYIWYPIFVFYKGQWYENADKYSPTTSKQTAQSRPFGNIIKLSHEGMKDLIQFAYQNKITA